MLAIMYDSAFLLPVLSVLTAMNCTRRLVVGKNGQGFIPEEAGWQG